MAFLLNFITQFFIFYALGFIGYFIFKKLKIPAPGVLGPLVFLGAANFFGLELPLPVMLRPYLSLFLGISLGLRISKFNGKGLLKLIILASIWLIGLSLLSTQILTLLGLDRFTALFSSIPGGLVEVAVMSMSFNADAFVVVLLQTSRMLLTLLIVPIIIRFLGKAAVSSEKKGELPATPPEEAVIKGKTVLPKAIEWLILVILGLISSWLLVQLRFPSPYLIGPMLCIGIYTRARDLKKEIHPKFEVIILIGISGLMGLSMNPESIMNMPSYIIPILALNIIIIGGSMLLALILKKASGWDIITCLLATAPGGGIAPMLMLSIEMGVDFKLVMVFQVLRLILVLLFTPVMSMLL